MRKYNVVTVGREFLVEAEARLELLAVVLDPIDGATHELLKGVINLTTRVGDLLIGKAACGHDDSFQVICVAVHLDKQRLHGIRDLDLFIANAQVSLVPVDEQQADLARRAFRKYGKGRHLAGLNFGDCFSYALSKATEAALLFKGNDFLQTDIECHPASTAGKA